MSDFVTEDELEEMATSNEEEKELSDIDTEDEQEEMATSNEGEKELSDFETEDEQKEMAKSNEGEKELREEEKESEFLTEDEQIVLNNSPGEREDCGEYERNSLDSVPQDEAGKNLMLSRFRIVV